MSQFETIIYGQPDEKFISTGHVERQNLTMRMHMRRFTRLTNGFSKKIENHSYAIALHFVYYNFAKIRFRDEANEMMEKYEDLQLYEFKKEFSTKYKQTFQPQFF